MPRLSELDEDERRLFGPYLYSDRPSGNEYRGFCLEHEDPSGSSSPSASYNFITGVWHCMACDAGGSIAAATRTLLKREKEDAKSNVIDLDGRRASKKPEKELPTDGQIDGFVEQLWSSPRLAEKLMERRGLTEHTLREWQVGWDSNSRRYTLPVRDRQGKLLNVRRYKPDARGDEPKMLPWSTGYGTQLFGAKALDEHTELVLCEGEMDLLALSEHGIPGVTHTGGAGAFQMAWVKEFKDKVVFICFDEDEGGRKGALRTARMLRAVTAAVFIVGNLGTNKPKGDITDFFLEGKTVTEFRALMDEVRPHPFAQDDSTRAAPTSGRPISLEESQSAEYSEPLELQVMVAGKQTPPYLAPRSMTARCDQQKGKVCTLCPMAAYNGERQMVTSPDDARLLHFVEANDSSQQAVMRDLFAAGCSDRIEFEVESHWPIEELVVVQSLEHRTEEVQTPMNRKVFNVNTYNTPVNSGARLVGQQVPDPRNSRGIFHSWHLEQVRADLDKFEVDEDLLEELSIFQCDPDQSPLDKCKEIADDLSANVTQIYGRQALHVAYDLVWHSALGFEFMGKPADKGWLECLVIGDTRTGKSEAATRLAYHYQAGIIKSCEGATFAGLVGGATQAPGGKNQWMVTWGTIPLNDRRLVVLDELSGLIANARGESKGIIEAMSSIRSSGKAQLVKVVSEETSARTRLIWISNPLNGKRMSEMAGGGMDAIRNLIANPEDVARFDFAIAAGNTEVPADLINSIEHTARPHIYKAEAASKLVTWAWSRRSDQVRWIRKSDEQVVRAAREVGAKYLNDPPLVQAENIRMKLARLAVAFAARTFSTNSTGQNIIVRPEHVESAVEFLDWIYGNEVMGYLRLSRRMEKDRAAAEQSRAPAQQYLAENPGVLDALRAVQDSESFRPRDFDEAGGTDVDSRTVVNVLANWRMIRRLPSSGGRWALEPTLVSIIKELEDSEL